MHSETRSTDSLSDLTGASAAFGATLISAALPILSLLALVALPIVALFVAPFFMMRGR